jgi:hypothetical protein
VPFGKSPAIDPVAPARLSRVTKLAVPAGLQSPVPCCQGGEFFLAGKAAQRLLRKSQCAVDRDLEDAAARLHEFDIGAQFAKFCSRTESPRFIVSLHAVFDPNLHRSYSILKDHGE